MLLVCLQVNQQYVQVQAIVSQVSSIKLYKFEYVPQRGKTTLGRKTASWRVKLKRQAQTIDMHDMYIAWAKKLQVGV